MTTKKTTGETARIELLVAALEPFSHFCTWIEAVNRLHEGEPISDHTAIVSSQGGGGSDYLLMADLRRARAAIERQNKTS